MSPANSDTGTHRVERILAFMVAGVIGLSIIAFLAFIIASSTGVPAATFGTGVWPVVVIFPLIGFPIGFVLIIVLLILFAVRRGREAREGQG